MEKSPGTGRPLSQPLRLQLHFGARGFAEGTRGPGAAAAVFAVAVVVSLSWATIDLVHRGWSFGCRCPMHPMYFVS